MRLFAGVSILLAAALLQAQDIPAAPQSNSSQPDVSGFNVSRYKLLSGKPPIMRPQRPG